MNDVHIDQGLSKEQRSKMYSLLEEYSDVFSKSDDDLGRTAIVTHPIPTGDAVPARQHNYRQPYHLRQEAERQTRTLLAQGVIEESDSPWSSPVLMVPKKDGTFRFCVDFRKLNVLTQWSDYPLPRVDETLEALAGSQMFSTLDLASGYWQVEVSKTDRCKTAFSTRDGKFQFVTMPMGLAGAPSTFQRLMDIILRGLQWHSVLVYLDDIVVYGRSFSEHQRRLVDVFQRLRSAGLKLKPRKCTLAAPSVLFLGHRVSSEGIATDSSKIDQVSSWPIPQTVRDVRSFLGLASYYRRFVENFSSIAAPLTELTRKHARFVWSRECEQAFNVLKAKLCSAPVLAYPIFNSAVPFILKTDASDLGIGAILAQKHNGFERVVAYASRKLTQTEQNYDVCDRELLAVVWALNHFKPYLYGQKFTIITDNEPITSLKSLKEPKGRKARWLQDISAFVFDIVHKPGRNHRDVDALSRNPAYGSASISPSSMTSHGISVVMAGEYSTEEVLNHQERDPDISLVLTELRSGPARPKAIGKWRHGVLKSYHRIWSQLGLLNGKVLVRTHRLRPQEEERKRLVVPKSLRQKLLKQVHDSVLSGHLGVDKTLARVQELYYWPGYSSDVEAYVRSCLVCQQRNAPIPHPRAALQPIPVGGPFEMLAMDMLELPQTDAGNKYCLLVTDYFTKWPEAYALKDQKAETVARALMDVIARHGIPQVLLSDQGRSFDNAVVKELCSKLQIHKVRTSAYHPQCDGLVERLNRTLLSMLSKYAHQRPAELGPILTTSHWCLSFLCPCHYWLCTVYSLVWPYL